MALLASTSVLAPAGGCVRETTARLQGAVTLAGKPIPADARAFIVFASGPDRSRSTTAPIIDGRYDSPHTPVGDVTVFFEISHPVGPERTSDRTGLAYRDVATLVPARYETGVPLNVAGDDAHRNFDLAP